MKQVEMNMNFNKHDLIGISSDKTVRDRLNKYTG